MQKITYVNSGTNINVLQSLSPHIYDEINNLKSFKNYQFNITSNI